MKNLIFLLSFIASNVVCNSLCAQTDYVSELKTLLSATAAETDNDLFRLHCNSIVKVIDAKTKLTSADSSFLKETYLVFSGEAINGCPLDFNSYLERERSLVVAWESPSDGKVSYTTVRLPKDWNPETEYPVYFRLHGYWDVAGNPINYLTYSFRNGPSSSYAHEDGYCVSPWGRGNQWYLGQSETDIWECMDMIEELFNTNPKRKYLSGHSMGGYGAWHIALSTPNYWAAIGIHAGAIWYNYNELGTAAAETLSDLPVYFVCGDEDGLLAVNNEQHRYLQQAGNTNLEFVTFPGGHDYRSVDVENMYDWMKEYTNENPSYADLEKKIEVTDISVFPNPFVQNTQIVVDMPNNGVVSIEVLSMTGKLVYSIFYGKLMGGEHTFYWHTAPLEEGTYLCVMTTLEQVISRKIVLRK